MLGFGDTESGFILSEISVIRFAFIISKIKHDDDVEGPTQKALQ